MAPSKPAAVKLNITPDSSGLKITPTNVGSNITKHKATRLDVSRLRSLGMSQDLAYMYAARGATPESLKEYADTKITKLYDSWKTKLRFEDELKQNGAFNPNKGSRTAMRLYFRYLHNFEKNKGLYLDPKNVILRQTDDARRKAIESHSQVSNLKGPEFWRNMAAKRGPPPLPEGPFKTDAEGRYLKINVVDPQEFKRPAITGYAHAAEQNPVVHDPTFIALTDEARMQEGYQIFLSGFLRDVLKQPNRPTLVYVHPDETILSLALRMGIDIDQFWFSFNGRPISTTFRLEGVVRNSTVGLNLRGRGGMEPVRCAECWTIPCVCSDTPRFQTSRIQRPCSVCSSFSDVCLCPGPKQYDEEDNFIVDEDRFCTLRFHGHDRRFVNLPATFSDCVMQVINEHPADLLDVIENCPHPRNLLFYDCFYLTVSYLNHRYVFDYLGCETDFDGSFYHPKFPYRPGMVVEVCTRLLGGSKSNNRRPGKVKCRGCGKAHPPPFDECFRMKKANDQAHRDRPRPAVEVPHEQPDAPPPPPAPKYDTTQVDCINAFEVRTDEVMIHVSRGDCWEHAQMISAIYHFPFWLLFIVGLTEAISLFLLVYPLEYISPPNWCYFAYILIAFPLSFRMAVASTRNTSRLLAYALGLDPCLLSPRFFHPEGPLLLPDGSLLPRRKLIFQILIPGVPAPRANRTDYEILNDDRINIMYVALTKTLRHPVSRLVFHLAIYTVIQERVKFINVSKIGPYLYDTEIDERAVGVGLSDFKKTQHHRIVRYMLYEGNEDLYQQRELHVSMTQVAQIYGLPALHNSSLSIADIDNMIEFNYKNLHIVNLPMHLNLAHSVCADTKLFIKLLVRNERHRSQLGGKMTKCPSPAF